MQQGQVLLLSKLRAGVKTLNVILRDMITKKEYTLQIN